MKKVIFAGLAVALALSWVACGNLNDSDNEIPSVQYSNDGSQVTLRIDGGGEPDKSLSRALTNNLAQRGHDFYEVVFVGGGTTARTSWAIGETASITGVDRSGSITNAATSAILFVGMQSDKTLLGVGQLTATTNADGTSGGAVITAITKTVTFSVTALTAGAQLGAGIADSSFFTSDDNTLANVDEVNTTITDTILDGSSVFPMYALPPGATTAATYTITGNNAAAFTACLPGILVNTAGLTTTDRIRCPRFFKNGDYMIPKGGNWASDTAGHITAVDTSGTNFLIEIEFNTSGVNTVGLCAFTFDIPVNAINATAAGGTTAINWHIRPGFGTGWTVLDNGLGSNGGAILLGIDVASADDTLWIIGTGL